MTALGIRGGGIRRIPFSIFSVLPNFWSYIIHVKLLTNIFQFEYDFLLLLLLMDIKGKR